MRFTQHDAYKKHVLSMRMDERFSPPDSLDTQDILPTAQPSSLIPLSGLYFVHFSNLNCLYLYMIFLVNQQQNRDHKCTYNHQVHLSTFHRNIIRCLTHIHCRLCVYWCSRSLKENFRNLFFNPLTATPLFKNSLFQRCKF